MISAISAANAAPTLINLSRPAAGARRDDAPKNAASFSFGDPREAAQAMRKEMASRRMNAVKERMGTLSLMIKADPRSALKLAAELAKELKAAVKDYQDAGGRNASASDLALIRSQISRAREARSAVTPAPDAPATPDPAVDQGDGGSVNADAEARRAQQAYAAASSAAFQERSIERLTALEAVAVADNGFFDLVKGLAKALRKAREDIRHESHSALRPPSEDDWKEADAAQVELERQINTAPAGLSVRV
ncbi:MAG: hypothetical protein K2Y04_09930 [Caulobacteraceae bacterium]|nr:hypothetical protein [Caulobacteraceae bacterium]